MFPCRLLESAVSSHCYLPVNLLDPNISRKIGLKKNKNYSGNYVPRINSLRTYTMCVTLCFFKMFAINKYTISFVTWIHCTISNRWSHKKTKQLVEGNG